MSDRGGPSKILLDECFAAEDDRFLDALTQFSSHDFLVSFADRWIQDPRPWAREQIVRYLQLTLETGEVALGSGLALPLVERKRGE